MSYPMTDEQRAAFRAFTAELHAVHALYRKQLGRTRRWLDIAEMMNPREAAAEAVIEPPALVRRNYRECFDRAQAAGRTLQAALGGGQ